MEGVVDGEDVAGGSWFTHSTIDAWAMRASKSRAGEGASEGPHTGGRQVAVDLDRGLAHGDAVEGDLRFGVVGTGAGSGGLRDGGDGQRIDEGLRASRGRVREPWCRRLQARRGGRGQRQPGLLAVTKLRRVIREGISKRKG